MLKSGRKVDIRGWKHNLQFSFDCSLCFERWSSWESRGCCRQLPSLRQHSVSTETVSRNQKREGATENVNRPPVLSATNIQLWHGILSMGSPPTQGTSLKSQQKVTVSPPAWFPQGVKQYAANTDYFHLLGLQGQQAWCFIYKPMCRGEPRA